MRTNQRKTSIGRMRRVARCLIAAGGLAMAAASRGEPLTTVFSYSGELRASGVDRGGPRGRGPNVWIGAGESGGGIASLRVLCDIVGDEHQSICRRVCHDRAGSDDD